MASQQLDEERIFHVARFIAGDEARRDYLDQVCSGNPALRDRVEGLLQVYDNEQSFLKSQSDRSSSSTTLSAPVEGPGEPIGRYTLREQIGEGGMGVVFVAEQERPIRRKVALKLIKPGMDSQAVIARFDAERQALAMLDHPNIAKVLDAGTTESGRPFFVMELVRGLPISEYCDNHRLSTDERLELFVTVCQAVQYAHQKGIIHRDVKPSNILVTRNGDRAIPKVIDFGVAKAVNQRLTEQTIYTQFSEMIGTPLYMSPEQAELSELDVDTRSDVYSLGVVLYELLTGSTPIEQERLRTAGYDEIRRMIREDEPPRPSARVSTLAAEQLSTVCERRRCAVDKFQHQLRGELDWIVMKAMEKDRVRRYDTPSSLASDVQRYLSDQPVKACPPSASYRLHKFVRRNRALIAATSIVCGSLIAATAMSLWFAIDRQQTLQQTHRLLVERGLWQSISGEFSEARDTAAIAEAAGVEEEWIYTILGSIAFHEGKVDDAIHDLDRALTDNPENVSALALLSFASAVAGRGEDWQQATDVLRDAQPGDVQPVFDELFLGYAFYFIDYEEAARKLQNVVQSHPSWLLPRHMIAAVLAHQAREERNIELARTAIQQIERFDAFQEPSPLVLTLKLHTCSTILALQEYADLDEVRAAGVACDEIGDRLAEFPEYAVGSVVRRELFSRTADEAKRKAAQEDLMAYGYGFWLYGPLAELITNEEYATILNLSDKGPELEIARAVVHAIQGNRQKALAIYRDLKQRHTSWYVRARIIEIPLLVGERDEAQRDATTWLQTTTGHPYEMQLEEERLRIVAQMRVPRLEPDAGPNQVFAYKTLAGLIAIANEDWEVAMRDLQFAINAPTTSVYAEWPAVYIKYATIMADRDAAEQGLVGQRGM